MGKFMTLRADDGFELSAWRADPTGKPRGGLVVVQEIYGVNHHIRSVADFFAAQGYLAVAPALFDRIERNVDLGYNAADRQTGIALISKADKAKLRIDVAAAELVARAGGKTAVVGYCLGGSLAYFAACDVAGLGAAVGYYGGMILDAKDGKVKAPTMLHFGETDANIPIARVREFIAQHPELTVYTYPAGHGFNCEERESFDAPSAALARTRTLEFLAKTIG